MSPNATSIYYAYYPLHIGSHRFREGRRSEVPARGTDALAWIQEGSGIVCFGSLSSRPISEGDFFYLPEGGACAELMPDSAEGLSVILVHFQSALVNGESAASVPEGTSLPQPLFIPGAVHHAPAPQTGSLLRQLGQALEERGELASLRRQLALGELILHLQAYRKVASAPAHDPLQLTIDYMEQRIGKPVQIGDLPDLAGMTPSSYSRAFKKLTGMSPGAYLTGLRMLRAKELMASGNAALRDVATSVGYQDELYFSRVFKKTEGVSPSVFMKRRDRRIAIVSSLQLQDHLLALGILPIAAPSFPSYFKTASGFPSFLQERLSGTIPLNAERPIRSEDVMRHSPDLVLRTRLNHDLGDKHWGEDGNADLIDESVTWEQYFREIAARVDRKTEAERVIRRMAQQEQETRRKLAEAAAAGKWAIVRLLPGKCRLYGSSDHAFTELFYQRLRFKPEKGLDFGAYRTVTPRELLQLDPEQLLILWTDESVYHAFASDPVWQRLRAVRESRVYYPDSREWDAWGPIGRAHTLKEMVKYFGRLQRGVSGREQARQGKEGRQAL
ncbi:MAG: putative transcriptional regulator [Paenibacillus sp.]|nr:putative transcriptional regulator [Paenibacillus sp.]